MPVDKAYKFIIFARFMWHIG